MLKNRISLQLAGEHFTLCSEKVVYWEEEKALLLSDVHAGKAAHFRKHGVPISTDHLLRDLNQIDILMEEFEITTIYFLGDLFHSDFNEENALIEAWISEKKCDCLLVAGNHDLHSLEQIKMPMVIELNIRSVYMSHEPTLRENMLNICGHLHPGFSISGPGRQRLKLPAFYAAPSHIILPAFGSLTGKRTYKEWVKMSDVYLITEEGMLDVRSLSA